MGALILGTLLPMVAFSALVLGWVQRQTREATERGLRDTARAISVVVDRELGGTIAALKLLATSEHLGSRDLKALHQAAHVAVATQAKSSTLWLSLTGGPGVSGLIRRPPGSTVASKSSWPGIGRFGYTPRP